VLNIIEASLHCEPVRQMRRFNHRPENGGFIFLCQTAEGDTFMRFMNGADRDAPSITGSSPIAEHWPILLGHIPMK
jgi:hypothetical protein